ncbi:hypothetical protein AB879_04770, partial [Staphylococcus aureus]
AMRVGVRAPTQKLTKSQLTIMCKLGMGPNTENFKKKFYRQCKLAGPQHREIQKEILQTMQVGE